MTPAEILKYLSPQEQAEALAKFIQVEGFDYSALPNHLAFDGTARVA